MGAASGQTPVATPACIGLGSNLGDRAANLAAAVDGLRALPGTRVIAVADVIDTEPVGPIPQGRYLNSAALVHTSLAPRVLLEHLFAIERSRGRDRSREQRWGPRTLDLDLLLYGESTVQEPGLTLPHPRLHERHFVLAPLAQIAGAMTVPPHGRTVRQLLQALRSAPRSAPTPT